MAKPSICMIVFNNIRTDARVNKEAETLAAAGFMLTVISVAGGSLAGAVVTRRFRVVEVAPWRWLARRGLPTFVYLPLRIAYYLALYAQVFIVAMRLEADFYHAHDVNTLPIVWLVAKLRGAKLIYDAHEISSSREGYSAASRIVRSVEGVLTPRVDAMLTTTAMRAEHFAASYGIPTPVVLQNRPRFYELTRGNKIRETLGLAPGRPIVLYQGVIQQGRGIHNIVEVARRVPEADFVFIGDGPQAAELDRLIAADGLKDRVFRIPTVPLEALPAYTCSADIGIQVLRNTCLNHYSTDSNKLFEYVMAGLPVVASDFPEIARVAKAFDFALLVDPHVVERVQEAVSRLVRDPDLRQRMAQSALAARRQLSWEAQEYVLTDQVYQPLQAPFAS